ncbi:MAG: BlaI/MecI/CopY family transcriptional regulator, partial [Acidobacteriaceae bacterium]
YYVPVVAEAEAGSSEVRLVLSRFFGNSREKLMLSLLGDSDVTPEELQRLKDAIEQAE